MNSGRTFTTACSPGNGPHEKLIKRLCRAGNHPAECPLSAHGQHHSGAMGNRCGVRLCGGRLDRLPHSWRTLPHRSSPHSRALHRAHQGCRWVAVVSCSSGGRSMWTPGRGRGRWPGRRWFGPSLGAGAGPPGPGAGIPAARPGTARRSRDGCVAQSWGQPIGHPCPGPQ